MFINFRKKNSISGDRKNIAQAMFAQAMFLFSSFFSSPALTWYFIKVFY